jgi:hypothetical protein
MDKISILQLKIEAEKNKEIEKKALKELKELKEKNKEIEKKEKQELKELKEKEKQELKELKQKSEKEVIELKIQRDKLKLIELEEKTLKTMSKTDPIEYLTKKYPNTPDIFKMITDLYESNHSIFIPSDNPYAKQIKHILRYLFTDHKLIIQIGKKYYCMLNGNWNVYDNIDAIIYWIHKHLFMSYKYYLDNKLFTTEMLDGKDLDMIKHINAFCSFDYSNKQILIDLKELFIDC